jgi:DNA-binding MltR family transcriptional regulator
MSRKPVRSFDLNAFSSVFRDESDRACAVLGAAQLDARLESLFERRLRFDQKALLTSMGPLSTFSARIKVSQALAWIHPDVAYDLDQIRQIRNEFAHSADHELSFADDALSSRAKTLKVAQTLIDANEYAASVPHPNLSVAAIRAMGSIYQSPRQRFEITVEMLAQHLDELPVELTQYVGPSLKDELWALASMPRIKISATGTVSPPPAESTPE